MTDLARFGIHPRFHPCPPYQPVSGRSIKTEGVMVMTNIFPLCVWDLVIAIATKVFIDFHEKLMPSMPYQRHAIEEK